MIELWTSKNQRVWNVIKKEGVDQILFPNSFCDKLLKALTLINGLQIVERKLRLEALEHHLEQNGQTRENEISDKDFEEYQKFIARSFPSYGTDVTVMITRDQLKTIMEKNSETVATDSGKKKCGRKGCPSPCKCYSFRKKKQDSGRSLYVLIKCPPVMPTKTKERRKKNKEEKKTIIFPKQD